MNYWLIKSEPYKYSWQQMLTDEVTFWDGVRSYPARVHLKAMQEGDLCFFYHSNEGKEIVGIVKVIKTHYQDPTTDDQNWVAVDVQAHKSLQTPVTLATIKATPELGEMALIKQMRLSVSPVTKQEFECILAMSNTNS